MAKSIPELHRKVGIIFLEIRGASDRSDNLDFDQVACAHLLLQMNKAQSLFDFQVITLHEKDNFNIPVVDLTPQTFDTEITKVKANPNKKVRDKFKDINYWIGVTSKPIPNNFFFLAPRPSAGPVDNLKQRVAVISTKDWVRAFSPPSLFEYVSLSVLICSLYLLSYEFKPEFEPHKTKGCIFDLTRDKPQRRILISNPILCSPCRENSKMLERNIRIAGNSASLTYTIKNLLKKEWMGSPETRDSPLYNLKKLYKYDVDRNSGFYKRWYEKIGDSIVDHLGEWTVGNVLGGVIGGLIAILFVAISRKP